MTWVYNSANGNLSKDGKLIAVGYSGHGPGVNNPSLQDQPNVGPIPQGTWSIGIFFDDLGGKGPIVARLAPAQGTDTFGRGGFMIHGDTASRDETASHGCIILDHATRQRIADSDDTEREVV